MADPAGLRGDRSTTVHSLRVLVLTFLALCSGACAHRLPPSPEVMRLLEEREEPFPCEKVQGTLTIDSDVMSGSFQFLMAIRRGASPAVRIRAFTDVGAVVFDLLATPQQIWGSAGEEDVVDIRLDDDRVPPRHFLVLLAVNLLEEVIPASPERALSGTQEGGGALVMTKTIVPGGEVETLLNDEGFPLRREFSFRRLGWTESFSPSGRRVIESSHVTMSIEPRRILPSDTIPDVLFVIPTSTGSHP